MYYLEYPRHINYDARSLLDMDITWKEVGGIHPSTVDQQISMWIECRNLQCWFVSAIQQMTHDQEKS